jgi:GINS complex subunit 3
MSCLTYVGLAPFSVSYGWADKALCQTFRKRAADIADHAHNPRGALGEGADFLRGLDEMERQLFRSAHDSTKAMKNWVANLKKS